MKIKIGNKVYESKNQPIMVILTDQDKINIACMEETDFNYCQFNPDKSTPEQIDEWMKK